MEEAIDVAGEWLGPRFLMINGKGFMAYSYTTVQQLQAQVEFEFKQRGTFYLNGRPLDDYDNETRLCDLGPGNLYFKPERLFGGARKLASKRGKSRSSKRSRKLRRSKTPKRQVIRRKHIPAYRLRK